MKAISPPTHPSRPPETWIKVELNGKKHMVPEQWVIDVCKQAVDHDIYFKTCVKVHNA